MNYTIRDLFSVSQYGDSSGYTEIFDSSKMTETSDSIKHSLNELVKKRLSHTSDKKYTSEDFEDVTNGFITITGVEENNEQLVLRFKTQAALTHDQEAWNGDIRLLLPRSFKLIINMNNLKNFILKRAHNGSYGEGGYLHMGDDGACLGTWGESLARLFNNSSLPLSVLLNELSAFLMSCNKNDVAGMWTQYYNQHNQVLSNKKPYECDNPKTAPERYHELILNIIDTQPKVMTWAATDMEERIIQCVKVIAESANLSDENKEDLEKWISQETK